MMEAVILAGGLGTRLRARISDRPKPMATINGQPFLAFLLDYLAQQGFESVVLSVGYQKNAIIQYFGERYRALAVRYAVEDQPLGTGGAIRHALTRTMADLVWVLNGDSFLKLDYRAMLRAHKTGGQRRAMTIALRPVEDVSRYGSVRLDGSWIIDFQASGRIGSGLINAGVYLLAPSLFGGFVLPRCFSFERDFLANNAGRLAIHGFQSNGWFIDIGVPGDYDRAQRELEPALHGRAASGGGC